MCIPQIAVLPLIESFRTKKTGEHPLSALFSLPRRVKTQKQEKLESANCPAKYPDVSTKTNQYTYLLLNKKSWRITENTADSIITVMGNRIKTREKDRNTLDTTLYLECFVFFPPQS